MAEHAACSREPSHQPEDATKGNGTCQARSFRLTNATLSDGGHLSSLASGSLDTTNNLSSGETVWKSDNTPSSGPVIICSTSQDPMDLTKFPTDSNVYHDEDDILKISQPTSVKLLTERDEKIKLIPAHGPRQPRTRLDKFKQASTLVLLCLLAICLLAIVITYVQATYAAGERSNGGRPLSDLLKTDVGRTLTILRTSQGILSASVSLALQNVFVLLQWSQMHPPDGISYLNVLALSPTTGALGTLNTTDSTLPPQFFTEASIIEPYAKMRFQPAMFALFLVLQIVSLLFVGGVVVWACIIPRTPLKTSSFPLFDIGFRADVQSDIENKDLNNLSDSEIVHLMRNAKAVSRSEV